MSTDSPFVDLQCGACGAQLRIDPGQRTARCPFCDAPSVVDRPPAPSRPMPVFALGFAVEREAATRAVRDWIRSRRMAPFGLRNLAVERMSGVYLPAYLYSATANSRYEASIAEIYKKVSIDRDDDGFSAGRRQETEYRDLTGRHVASLADILVTASHNVSNEEIQAIEPFDLGRLRRYTPALLQGWSAEEMSGSPETCLGHAQGEARASVTRLVHQFMPGDGVRSLRHSSPFVVNLIYIMNRRSFLKVTAGAAASAALAFAARQLLGRGVDKSSWCLLSFPVVEAAKLLSL